MSVYILHTAWNHGWESWPDAPSSFPNDDKVFGNNLILIQEINPREKNP